jgi:hypothetical protein
MRQVSEEKAEYFMLSFDGVERALNPAFPKT